MTELDNIPEFYETAEAWEAAEGAQMIGRDVIEAAIGFLGAPDRERVLERLGYSDNDIAAYFRARGEASLPCLQPRVEAQLSDEDTGVPCLSLIRRREDDSGQH